MDISKIVKELEDFAEKATFRLYEDLTAKVDSGNLKFSSFPHFGCSFTIIKVQDEYENIIGFVSPLSGRAFFMEKVKKNEKDLKKYKQMLKSRGYMVMISDKKDLFDEMDTETRNIGLNFVDKYEEDSNK